MATGLERYLGDNAKIGLALGYSHTDMKLKSSMIPGLKNDITGNAFHTALYGGMRFGEAFFLDGYAGYSFTYNNASVFDPDLEDSFAFDRSFHDHIYSAGLKGSYVFTVGDGTRIIPSLGLDYAYAKQGAWNAVDADGSPLWANSTSFNDLEMPLMLKVNHTFGSGNTLWTPEIRGGWIPRFGSDTADFMLTSVENSIPEYYSVKSSSLGHSRGVIGAGITGQFAGRHSLGVNYDFSFGKKRTQHLLSLDYGLSF